MANRRKTIHEPTQSPTSDADFSNRAFTKGRNQPNQLDHDGRWAGRRQEAIGDTFEKSMRIKGVHGRRGRGFLSQQPA
jgi:hypothetical protein